MDRRELLGVLGASGLASVFGATAEAHADGHGDRVHEDCLKACEACERSCNETFHHCYTQVAAGKKEHANALRLVADCAKFCDLSSDLIASQSPLMVHSCMACAEACKSCASECEKFDSAEMKACAKACRDCENTCHAMVTAMGHEHHHD